MYRLLGAEQAKRAGIDRDIGATSEDFQRAYAN
jgi:hypothetical protein